jgi:hypothetical protein
LVSGTSSFLFTQASREVSHKASPYAPARQSQGPIRIRAQPGATHRVSSRTGLPEKTVRFGAFLQLARQFGLWRSQENGFQGFTAETAEFAEKILGNSAFSRVLCGEKGLSHSVDKPSMYFENTMQFSIPVRPILFELC